MQLTDRVALVTGAGSRIGKAAALLLADAGARIGVLSRDEDEVNQVVREIEQAGGEAIPIIADISIVEDMQRSYRQIRSVGAARHRLCQRGHQREVGAD